MPSRLGDQLDRHPRAVTAGVLGGALVLLVVAVGMAIAVFGTRPTGEGFPVPSASATPFASPTSEASSSPASATPMTAPSASPSVENGFRHGDILRIEVNGLAVRQAPMVTSPIAQGYQFDGMRSWEPVGDVRLNAGDLVWVQLGPLPLGDTVWYLVWPAEGQVPWDSNGDFETVGGGDPAWVAAAVGEDEYLSLYRRPEPSEYASWPAGGPQTLMIAGTGDFESEAQVQHDLFAFSWAVTADDDRSPCAFEVTLLPEDDAEPVMAVDVSTSGFEQGPTTGPSAVLNTPWEPSAGGSSGSFTVSITSGCTWAVVLWPLAHD